MSRFKRAADAARTIVNPIAVLQAFGVKYSDMNGVFSCACPVHAGDNLTGMKVWPDTNRWKCWTHACDQKFWGDGTGLCQGILTRRLSRAVSRKEAAEWLKKNGGENSFILAAELNEALEFAKLTKKLYGSVEERPIQLPTIEQVRARLIVPSPYFLKRGYSREILDLFSVGERVDKSTRSPLWNRDIAPVCSLDGKFVVGYSGRWTPEDRPSSTPKWLHEGFLSGNHLYGLHLAMEAIEKTGTIVLVEGPGDVWALRAHGVNNAVATFGTRIFDGQQLILESLPIHTVMVAPDADPPGDEGAAVTIAALSRLVTTRRVKPPGCKDWGECSGSLHSLEIRKMLTAEF